MPWRTVDLDVFEEPAFGIWSRAALEEQMDREGQAKEDDRSVQRLAALAGRLADRPLGSKSGRNQRILNMRASGSTLQEIADEMGVSRQRIFQICGPSRDSQVPRIAAALRLAGGKRPYADIARELGVTHANVCQVAVREGLSDGSKRQQAVALTSRTRGSGLMPIDLELHAGQ